MRRIVVIAAGRAGVTCATGLKRRFPESEVNLLLPVGLEALQEPKGPAGRRIAQTLPLLDLPSCREVGVVETSGVMPDIMARDVTVSSPRGRITMRYEDLVVEVLASARLPRALQKAENVFGWPMPGYSPDAVPCDEALARAAETGEPVLVVGSGMPALDAVCLAREAGARVRWILTGEQDAPSVEPHVQALALKEMGVDVQCTAVKGLMAASLEFGLTNDGKTLTQITLPGGESVACSCCLWTTPLMARHPLLREDGFVLDATGRLEAGEGVEESLKILLMGSGASMPPAPLAGGAVSAPAFPGGDEADAATAAWVVERLAGNAAPKGPLLFAVRRAYNSSLVVCRAGLSMAEAEQAGVSAEHALVYVENTRGTPFEDECPEPGALGLVLVCHKETRTLLGAQALGARGMRCMTDGLFNAALAAVASGDSLETLALREATGLCGAMLRRAVAILRHKLEDKIRGISPGELLDSVEAGAEFFLLDLRPQHDFLAGRLPGAHNIPLPQLKKRLQSEVPHFTPIVLTSATGNDAYAVACRLSNLGAQDLFVLDGGMNAWPFALESGKP